ARCLLRPRGPDLRRVERRDRRQVARPAVFHLRRRPDAGVCAAACERPLRHRLGSRRAMADAPLLELRGITKRFPGVVANDHIDFDLRRGEVHALLGENGAGKSTLMNILYGLYTPDEGEILLEGRKVELGSTKSAIEHGIGMVHQHFMLIPVMT